MANSSADKRGLKRICPNCGTRYYDFNNRPIICPSCQTQFAADVAKQRGRRIKEDDNAKTATTNDRASINAENEENDNISLDDLEKEQSSADLDDDDLDNEAADLDLDDLEKSLDDIDDVDDDDLDDDLSDDLDIRIEKDDE